MFMVARPKCSALDVRECGQNMCIYRILMDEFLFSQLFQISVNEKSNIRSERKCVMKTGGGWIWPTAICSGGADCVGYSAIEFIN